MKVVVDTKGKTIAYIVLAILVAKVIKAAEYLEPTIFGKSIPYASSNYKQQVQKICDCRWVCFALTNCTHASVKEDGGGNLQCLVSYAVAEYHLLVPDYAATFVKMPKYDIKGHEMYYKLFSAGLDWLSANQTCYQEGGQLAIVNTNKTFSEVSSILQVAGISKAWIGLYNYDPLPVAFQDLRWFNRSGYVPEKDIPGAYISRCFKLSKGSAHWTIGWNDNCQNGIPFVCQRLY